MKKTVYNLIDQWSSVRNYLDIRRMMRIVNLVVFNDFDDRILEIIKFLIYFTMKNTKTVKYLTSVFNIPDIE
jgi:hypothetical protein